MSSRDNTEYGNVSPQLDELSSTLMGNALDLLAEGEPVNVLLVMQNAVGAVESYEFSDDATSTLIDEARAHVRKSSDAVRYAITYVGAIEMDDGAFADALLLEFGEKGHPSFSAYSLFEGAGRGNGFRWTDPAPAGEEEPLLG